jgi:hypothetical protein
VQRCKNRNIKKIWKSRIDKDEFIDVVINQKCAHSGVYFYKNSEIISPRFIKIYEDTTKNKFEDSNYILVDFKNNIKNKIKNDIYDLLCNDVCVFIPSHICYDLQLTYLDKCLMSLLHQNKKIDIFVSISYEDKYEKETIKLIDKFKLKDIYFNIEKTQKYQMEHIYLLTKIIENKFYDLIFFCDDDDTYEPNRIEQMISCMHYTYLNIEKEQKKLLGGIREYIKDEDYSIKYQVSIKYKVPEYWAYGIKQCVLENFLVFF